MTRDVKEAFSATPKELAAQLEQAFFSGAQRVASVSGEVYLARVELEPFIESHLSEQWLEEEGGYYEGIEEFLLIITDSGPEIILEWEAVGAGPPSWHWYAGMFRIGDRGYMYAWNEPDVESGQPMFASWAPYADDAAFSTAFVEAYRQDPETMWFGSSVTLGDRVTRTMLEEGLVATGIWRTNHDGLPVDESIHRDRVQAFLE